MGLVAKLYGPRNVRLQRETIPEPGMWQVKVRTMFDSISHGTEMTFYQGTHPRMREDYKPFLTPRVSYPCVLGYEEVCQVAEVGENIRGLKENDIVCANIGHREEALCDTRSSWICKVPDRVKPEEAIFTALGSVGLYAVRRRSGISIGDNVAIFGQGAVGLMVTQACRLSGAQKIIATDIFDRRVRTARDLGVDVAFNSRYENPVKRITAETDGKGVDLVFDCAGVSEVLSAALKVTRHCGRIVVVAMHRKPLENVHLGSDFHIRELEIVSTQGRERPDLFLNLLAKEKIKVKPLITSRIPFLQIQEAYELIENKTQEEIKILLTFNK